MGRKKSRRDRLKLSEKQKRQVELINGQGKNKKESNKKEKDDFLFFVMAIVSIVVLFFVGKDIVNKVARTHIEKVTVLEGTLIREGKTPVSSRRASWPYAEIHYKLLGEDGHTYEMDMLQFMGISFDIGDSVHVFASNYADRDNKAATVSRVISEISIFGIFLIFFCVYGYFSLDTLGLVKKRIKFPRFLTQNYVLALFAILFFSIILFGTVFDPLDTYLCELNLGEGKHRGDVVLLGEYEQDGDLQNGPEAIAWRVLSVKNEEALLICDSILEYCHYDPKDEGGSIWSKSTLRDYLNGEFYQNTFSETEKEFLIEENVYSIPEGKGPVDYPVDVSRDKVFVLSYQEYQKYIMKYKVKLNGPTIFAQQWYDQYLAVKDELEGWKYTEIEGVKVKCGVRDDYTQRNGPEYYWMRNIFITIDLVKVVPTSLDKTFDNANVRNKIYGVRPVIRVPISVITQ